MGVHSDTEPKPENGEEGRSPLQKRLDQMREAPDSGAKPGDGGLELPARRDPRLAALAAAEAHDYDELVAQRERSRIGPAILRGLQTAGALPWRASAAAVSGIYRLLHATAALLWRATAATGGGLYRFVQIAGVLLWRACAATGEGLVRLLQATGALLWRASAATGRGIYRLLHATAALLWRASAAAVSGICRLPRAVGAMSWGGATAAAGSLDRLSTSGQRVRAAGSSAIDALGRGSAAAQRSLADRLGELLNAAWERRRALAIVTVSIAVVGYGARMLWVHGPAGWGAARDSGHVAYDALVDLGADVHRTAEFVGLIDALPRQPPATQPDDSPTPQRHVLEVITVPSGARVGVADKRFVSPGELELAELDGALRVHVRKQGHQPVWRRVKAEDFKRVDGVMRHTVRVRLQRLPAKAAAEPSPARAEATETTEGAQDRTPEQHATAAATVEVIDLPEVRSKNGKLVDVQKSKGEKRQVVDLPEIRSWSQPQTASD